MYFIDLHCEHTPQGGSTKSHGITYMGGGGQGFFFTPPPHFFTYLLKLIAYKKVILYWENNQSSVFLHHNKIRLGFIDFHKKSEKFTQSISA